MAVLDLLREFKWRGKGYPLSSLRTMLAQDLAEHKYWGKDGARVESTGRAPLVFDVVIPFRNGIAKGRSESWGTLYPDAYRAFLVDFADKSIGVFDHPELGEIACKCRSAESTLEASRRDGQDVHAIFIETIVPINDTSPFADPSPAAGAQQAGFDMDLALKTITPPLTPVQPTTFKPNFSDSIRSILAVGDTVSLLSKQVGGKFAELKYRADQIETSALGAKNSLLWPLIANAEKIKHVANSGQRGRLLQQQRGTSIYIVPQRTTLAALVIDIPEATLNDLIRLNPSLPAQPAVEAKTVVRYYTPKTRR